MTKKLTYEQFVKRICRYDRKHYKAVELKEQYPEFYAQFFHSVNVFASEIINDIKQQLDNKSQA